MTEQVEYVQGVAPIGLRLAYDHSANLRRITHEPRVPETLHEGVKPTGVAGALKADRHRPGQGRIELFNRKTLVDQLVFTHLSRPRVQHRPLRLACVQVASHECHGAGLLSESAVAQGEHGNSGRPFS
jgi:hypothetical protein